MNQMLENALVSNAASMGFNWIYNMTYLDNLSKEMSLVFKPVDKNHYDRAKKAYLAYPYAQIGDFSFQGHIAKWLYSELKNNPGFSKDDYLNMIFDHIQPGGLYVGWVESYGKKLVMNRLSHFMKIHDEPFIDHDDQLIGFIPYIVCKALNINTTKAVELSKAFTDLEAYAQYYAMFDHIIEHAPSLGLKKSIASSLHLAPKVYQEVLELAISNIDYQSFIQKHSGTACHIPHAIPLIIHILYHTTSFEQAVSLNTKIGGASCDRGMLIGSICGLVSLPSKTWVEQTNL